MSRYQRIARYAYLCLMSLGALIGALGILSAIKSFADNTAIPGIGWWHYPVLSSGGTGIVLFLMTAGFFAIFVHRGMHLLAPLLYIASYLATAFGFVVFLVGIEKGGAPGPRLTTTDVFTGAAAYLGPALLVTAAGLIWNYRAAARTPAL